MIIEINDLIQFYSGKKKLYGFITKDKVVTGSGEFIEVRNAIDPDDSHNFISVSISKTPAILAGEFKKKININDIFNFIKINYIDLMKIWNGQADFLDIFGKKY